MVMGLSWYFCAHEHQNMCTFVFGGKGFNVMFITWLVCLFVCRYTWTMELCTFDFGDRFYCNVQWFAWLFVYLNIYIFGFAELLLMYCSLVAAYIRSRDKILPKQTHRLQISPNSNNQSEHFLPVMLFSTNFYQNWKLVNSSGRHGNEKYERSATKKVDTQRNLIVWHFVFVNKIW